jgi:hypothetical protein
VKPANPPRITLRSTLLTIHDPGEKTSDAWKSAMPITTIAFSPSIQ